MEVKAPWLRFYGNTPAHLDYPDQSMCDLLEETAAKHPDLVACEFLGHQYRYPELVREVHRCAKALRALGVRPGDRVTICLPNTPQAVILFYALNRMGALCNMVHPLSSQGEIAFFLNTAQSAVAVTLDRFWEKFEAVRAETPLRTLIVTSIADGLTPLMRLGYTLTEGRKDPKLPRDADVLWWRDFLRGAEQYAAADWRSEQRGADPAAVLYSGGTTGTTKGILLTNLNFNALALQTAAAGDCIVPGHAMLSIMPMFHGFGLGIGIHTMLVAGCKCILVPQFTVKTYAGLLRKHRPNYIAGVPTLFEALLRMKDIDDLDLSALEGVFSGGDSLSAELKHKVDAFLHAHGATVQVREGYGTTECVTASCLTPKNDYREGSIGVPFPDTYYKICAPNTHDEVPYGDLGEICISGPSVMREYVGNEKETAQTLQLHADGRIWLHTGDLGSMDEDGFIYFKQRLKRVIISSGYNIYPSQLENIIDAHPAVLMSTVIGVHDDYRMQKPKAFVVLRPEYQPTDELKNSILEHCRRNIAKYAMPCEFEYRDSLPKTLVGKVAYTVLEKEEAARAAQPKN